MDYVLKYFFNTIFIQIFPDFLRNNQYSLLRREILQIISNYSEISVFCLLLILSHSSRDTAPFLFSSI